MAENENINVKAEEVNPEVSEEKESAEAQETVQGREPEEAAAKEETREEAKEAREQEKEEEVDLGTVRIADDVVAMIAGYTAKDVDGVADMAGSNTSAFLRSASYRRPVKGVRVEVNDGNVRVDLAVIMEYGYNIPATSSTIQARVKQSIENMTGLTVQDVNVRIAGIHMPGQDQ